MNKFGNRSIESGFKLNYYKTHAPHDVETMATDIKIFVFLSQTRTADESFLV